MTEADVLIAGAGPVGLATALGLARLGVRAVIVDQAASLNTAPRAMAYLYPVMQGLDNLGILDDLKTVGLVGDGVTFVDMASGESFPQQLDVLEGHVPHPYVVHLGQDRVGQVLIEHLAAHPGVEIRWNHRVTALHNGADGVQVEVETPDGGDVVRAKWLVGADGASSTIRELLGLDFEGFTWPERFVSTNVRYPFEKHGLRKANWRMDSHYGAVIARIDATDLWRFTFRESGELPLESLEDRIHAHFVNALPGHDSYELVQYAPYRMHQRCVKNFRHGRVVLAGDAAHVTNPVGGLGLTGGFLDSFVLYEALAAVVHGQADDSVLDDYAERRRKVWTDVVSPMATQLKTMVFDPPTGEERARMLAGLRALTHDPDLRREDLLRQGAIATPSVLPRPVTAG